MNNDFKNDIKEFYTFLSDVKIPTSKKKEKYKVLLKKYHPDRNQGEEYNYYVKKIISVYKTFDKLKKISLKYDKGVVDKENIEKGMYYYYKAKDLIIQGTNYGDNELMKTNNIKIIQVFRLSLSYFDFVLKESDDCIYLATAKEYKNNIVNTIKRICKKTL